MLSLRGHLSTLGKRKNQGVSRSYSTEANENVFELYNTQNRTTREFKKAQIQKWRDQRAKKNALAAQSGLKTDWIHKKRPIVVAPEPESWEIEYHEWKERWEAPIEAQRPDMSPLTSVIEGEEKRDEADNTGALSREPGPRITKADKMNDRKSLRRQLEQRLFLLVKKDRPSHAWQLPQIPLPLYETFEVNKTQNLRDYAQSHVNTLVGKNADIYMCGNAPYGLYSYPFPKNVQKEFDAYGSKLFFYYGFYVKGNIRLASKYSDHVWVTKGEMEEYLQDKSLYRYLEKALP